MADKYRIISDGNKTEVFAPDGTKMNNVTSIKIEQQAGKTLIAYATLVFVQPEVDIECSSLNG